MFVRLTDGMVPVWWPVDDCKRALVEFGRASGAYHMRNPQLRGGAVATCGTPEQLRRTVADFDLAVRAP